MTKKQKREADLLRELQADHGYTIMAVRPRERLATKVKMRPGEPMKTEPAVVLKLVVPQKSSLATQVLRAGYAEERKRR